jgi:hypothetical protein
MTKMADIAERVNGWQMDARNTGMVSERMWKKAKKKEWKMCWWIEKNVWSQVDADCSKQTGMKEDWRGLHPAVDDERLKMMMMMIIQILHERWSENNDPRLTHELTNQAVFNRQNCKLKRNLN